MLIIDIIIVFLISAIIFNLYLFRFEYKNRVVALWSKLLKNTLKRIQVKHKVPEHEFFNNTENKVSNIDCINTNNSTVRFNKPKIIYKSSHRVKKAPKPNTMFVRTAVKLKPRIDYKKSPYLGL